MNWQLSEDIWAAGLKADNGGIGVDENGKRLDIPPAPTPRPDRKGANE